MIGTTPLTLQKVNGERESTVDDIPDRLVQLCAVGGHARCGDRAHRPGADVEHAEPTPARGRPVVRVNDRHRREQIAIKGIDALAAGHNRPPRTQEGGIDRLEFSTHERLPLAFVKRSRFVWALEGPRLPVDVSQYVTVWVLPGMILLPLRDQTRPVRLDLVRPTRQRTNRACELCDLAVIPDGEPVAGERCDPCRVGAGGELALRVHDRVELHRHPGVDVRPPTVPPEHIHVQPQVTVDVRIERT